MYLGPAFPATCKLCGKKVGVPLLSMLTIAPFIVSIFLAPKFESAVGQTAIIFSGFLIYLILHIKVVPLETR